MQQSQQPSFNNNNQQQSSQFSYGTCMNKSAPATYPLSQLLLPNQYPNISQQNSMEQDQQQQQQQYIELCIQLCMQQQQQQQQLMSQQISAPNSSSLTHDNTQISKTQNNQICLLPSTFCSTPAFQQQNELSSLFSAQGFPLNQANNALPKSSQDNQLQDLSFLLGSLSQEDAAAAAELIYQSIRGVGEMEQKQQQQHHHLQQQFNGIYVSTDIQPTNYLAKSTNNPLGRQAEIQLPGASSCVTNLFDEETLLNQFTSVAAAAAAAATTNTTAVSPSSNLKPNTDSNRHIKQTSIFPTDSPAFSLGTTGKSSFSKVTPQSKKKYPQRRAVGHVPVAETAVTTTTSVRTESIEENKVQENNNSSMDITSQNNNMDYNNNNPGYDSAMIDEFTLLITSLLSSAAAAATSTATGQQQQSSSFSGSGKTADSSPFPDIIPTIAKEEAKSQISHRSKAIKKRPTNKQSTLHPAVARVETSEQKNSSISSASRQTVIVVEAKEEEQKNCTIIPQVTKTNTSTVQTPTQMHQYQTNQTSMVGFSRFLRSPPQAAVTSSSGNNSAFKLKQSPMSGNNSAFKLRASEIGCANSNSAFHLVKSPSGNSHFNSKIVTPPNNNTNNSSNTNQNHCSFLASTDEVITRDTLPLIKRDINNIFDANDLIVAAATYSATSPIRCQSFKITEEEEMDVEEEEEVCIEQTINKVSAADCQQLQEQQHSPLTLISEMEDQGQQLLLHSSGSQSSSCSSRKRRSEAERLVLQNPQPRGLSKQALSKKKLNQLVAAKKATTRQSAAIIRLRKRDSVEQESAIKPAEENEELFGNMDSFSEATQGIICAFEKYYLKALQTSKMAASSPYVNDFKNFIKAARKNDEHIGLLLNPRVCIYSTKFLEFLRGPAIEWIRKNVDQNRQPTYIQLIQIFKSEDKGITGLRPRKDRNLLSNLSLRK